MIRLALRYIRHWFDRPGVRRTAQHATAAFVTAFTGVLVSALQGLNGTLDAKLIVSVIVGALSAGGVAVFRALFPPAEVPTMLTVNQTVAGLDHAELASGVAAALVKIQEQAKSKST